MKKLIVILSFAVLLGCATTQSPPPVSHNTEQVRPENQSEEAKEAGKKATGIIFDIGSTLLIGNWLGLWPF